MEKCYICGRTENVMPVEFQTPTVLTNHICQEHQAEILREFVKQNSRYPTIGANIQIIISTLREKALSGIAGITTQQAIENVEQAIKPKRRKNADIKN